MRAVLHCVFRLSLLQLVACAAMAQESAAPQSEGAADAAVPLRVGLTVLDEELIPGEPVFVRFTLSNPGTEPITLPASLPLAGDDGVSLPLALVFGTPASPALTVQPAGGVPEVILPPPLAESGAEARSVVLAPRGLVGIELDVREFCRTLRYPGGFTLAWRPFGIGGPSAKVELRVEARKDALVVTDFGKLTIQLAYDAAPKNVENFRDLVRQGFYTGLAFHRVVPEYAISGGCPLGDGTGARPDGVTIPAELSNSPFDIGTVAMAHLPEDPDSASCQFFITLGRYPQLDGRYTIIGQCRDDASLRTLRAISDLPIDRNYRPLRNVQIRSINLIDRETGAVLPTVRGPLSLPPSARPRFDDFDPRVPLTPPGAVARPEAARGDAEMTPIQTRARTPAPAALRPSSPPAVRPPAPAPRPIGTMTPVNPGASRSAPARPVPPAPRARSTGPIEEMQPVPR